MKNKIKREIIDQFHESKQKSKLTLLVDEIKTSIFSVLFVLLKDDQPTTTDFLIVVKIFLEYIQIIQFFFNSSLISVWSSSVIFDAFYQIIDYLAITKYFISFLGSTTFTIEFYLFVILIFFILADIVYVAVSFNKKEFKYIWPLQILYHFVNLFISLFFIPVISTFTQMVI